LTDLLRWNGGDIRALLTGPAALIQGDVPNTVAVAGQTSAMLSFVFGSGLAVNLSKSPAATSTAPSGVADLVTEIWQANSGEDSSKIALRKITATDGSVSWVVSIPGTKLWQVDNPPNPFDLATNLKAAGGQVNAVGAGVTAALADAGAKPGQPVLLAGHSQGGIVAAQLASDPAFTSAFTVAGVLTVGSPIAGLRPTPSTTVLSLEHTQDLVPALAGEINPAGRNHTTVSRDLSKADQPELREAAEDPAGVESHWIGRYVNTGELVDASDDPSIRSWLDDMKPMMDQDASVELVEYDIRRKSEWETKYKVDRGIGVTAPVPGG
jgi:hypothetical protein